MNQGDAANEPQEGQIQNPGDIETVHSGDAQFLGSLGGLLGGTQAGCKPEPWAMSAASSAPSVIANLAVDQAPDKANFIARILVPGEFQGANWAWSGDGINWRVHRGGFLDRCTDPTVQPNQVAAATITAVPRGGAQPGQQAPPLQLPAGGSPMSGTPANLAAMGLVGVPPNIVQVRRCPPKMRMAIDGNCYLAKVLPRALWANPSKKAPLSRRDADNIRKGFAAAERIKKYGVTATKRARALVPPKRRRIAPPTKR